MNATIYSHKTIIGTADLQVGDESMGCVFGQFIPNDNYFKDIQKFVWEFWATNKPDYDKWYSLRFNARLDNQCPEKSLARTAKFKSLTMLY